MLAESLLAWLPPTDDNEVDARLAAYRVASVLNRIETFLTAKPGKRKG